MKIASHIHTLRMKRANQGFTLIELLVVISIIAVLAGLLFPAMGAVRNMARKTSAKNDVTQIVNAVKMFYTEYGRYPVTGTGVITYRTNNDTVFTVLTNSATSTLNPRKIRFLEIPNTKIREASVNAKSGLDTAGVWRDPWGNPYGVVIDASYTGSVGTVGVPALGGQTAYSSGGAVQTEVVAYSQGNPTAKTAEPVLSWQ